jgi:hypothetical protein
MGILIISWVCEGTHVSAGMIIHLSSVKLMEKEELFG